jgi:hypothetical protein
MQPPVWYSRCAIIYGTTACQERHMFTGSLSDNRLNLGIPPLVRQELSDEARSLGMQVPEVVRHILLKWRENRIARREREQQ